MKAQLESSGMLSPEGIFCFLWSSCEGSEFLSLAKKPPTIFEQEVVSALQESEAVVVADRLAGLIPNGDLTDLEVLGRYLCMLRCIDICFYMIHPRAVIFSPASPIKCTTPKWLENLRERRIFTGYYFRSDTHILISRGPLKRESRTECAVYGDSFPDKFSSLSVVSRKVHLNGRPVELNFSVVGGNEIDGVGSGSPPGEERIGFIPLITAAHDLRITPCHREEGFLDYHVAPAVRPANRLATALAQIGKLDIAIAPELIMTEEHAEEIAEQLDARPLANCRVIVAGSGHTFASQHDQHWNQSSIVNSKGSVLWQQRKLWPAGITQEQARAYGVDNLGPTPLLKENNAAGNKLEIVDIEFLGRCIVWICQDLTAQAMTSEIIRSIQPDWVFIPILDKGIDVGRWTHYKTFALSGESSARFLVCSSTALADMIGKEKPWNCGMALGPLAQVGEDLGRQFLLCEIGPAATGYSAVIDWNSAAWQQTTLTATSFAPASAVSTPASPVSRSEESLKSSPAAMQGPLSDPQRE